MTLSYDEAGDGPAVLLLHAGVCDRRMWDPQFDALAAAGHRVVRADLRGFGATPVAEEPYTNSGDVLALMDRLGIERAALVGASFGGRVALFTALRAAERLTALALLNAPLPGQGGCASPELIAFDRRETELFEAGDLDAAAALNVETWMGPEAGEATRAAVHAMQLHAFEVQSAAERAVEKEGARYVLSAAEAEGPYDLAGIGIPLLIASGAHDLSDFRAGASHLAAAVPGARHVELPWAGHLPSLERPDEITALLKDFLAGAVRGDRERA
ncbi:alpha/beta fold hydrolase [Streptomyces sp. t39]|uniref:alpha/beta fold hydrolase n=1 Tax=Streptomyces sp. t39 TaxID=1828156 RepID=UPI0011CD92DC|nr:alpha/beta fold hydrolase [Streptomyces sp. t39]TXS56552.1 alpha/beta fold hydrolase [Streptomyces sp. t39]